MIPNLCLFFSLALVVVNFVISLNKSCKTYLGPMLPPGGINWQLISPHYNVFLSVSHFLPSLMVPTRVEPPMPLNLTLVWKLLTVTSS